MIYVLCTDNVQPSGGVRKLYLHVDVLNARGVPATLVHFAEGFRCNWFANQTLVTHAAAVNPVPAKDFVVVPEVMGPGLASVAVGVPKVVFNQNAYLTFHNYKIQPDVVTPYRHAEVVGAFCVSEDNRRYLSYAFPDLFLQRLHYGIDPALFHPGDAKLPQVAVMTRKLREQAVQIVNLLQLRGAVGGSTDVAVKLIHDLPEDQAAAVLRQSLVFLSLSHEEGFGLPPAEAMACGCVVIGYHGLGGREFMLPEHAFPVETDDVIAYAQTVEQVLARWRSGDGELRAMADRAARFVAERYSRQREADDIVAAWRNLHARLGRPFPASARGGG